MAIRYCYVVIYTPFTKIIAQKHQIMVTWRKSGDKLVFEAVANDDRDILCDKFPRINFSARFVEKACGM